MTLRFNPPEIRENPNGWGPPLGTVPEKFKDMPYQPFSKGDRLGKVSDWTGATYPDRKYQNKYASTYGGNQQYVYSYYHEEDESSFQLVDTTRAPKPLYQRGRFMRRANRGRQQQTRQNQPQILRGSNRRGQQRKMNRWGYRGRYDHQNRMPVKMRESSVTVKPTWKVVEEMDFPRLTKLSLPNVSDPVDLRLCGKMEYYDRSFDRVNTKVERRLIRIDRINHKVTTTDDPIIRQLAMEGKGNIFATDVILATIMCCTRSVYSWDIVIDKVDDKLFFDKRDDSEFDLLSVNETSSEPPQEEGASINSPRNLALEALFINHNFSQQVLRMNEESYKFPEENPFAMEGEEGELASVGYRYRSWDLGNGMQLVSRCEHDAVLPGPNGEVQFLNVKALNEWDPRFSGGIEWRQKLDTQRGAVLANELKNNSNKLAKWTIQAIMAGSDHIKFGYVSRQTVRDSARHVILGTQQFKPVEFANQINLSMDNAWGILRTLVDLCMKLPDGKYLLIKDPNKPMVRLYDVPDDTVLRNVSQKCVMENDEDSQTAIVTAVLVRKLKSGWAQRDMESFFECLQANIVRGRNARDFLCWKDVHALAQSEDSHFDFVAWLLHHIFGTMLNAPENAKDTEKYAIVIADCFLMLADSMPSIFERIFSATLDDLEYLLLMLSSNTSERRFFGLKPDFQTAKLEYFPIIQDSEQVLLRLMQVLKYVIGETPLVQPLYSEMWIKLAHVLEHGSLGMQVLALECTDQLVQDYAPDDACWKIILELIETNVFGRGNCVCDADLEDKVMIVTGRLLESQVDEQVPDYFSCQVAAMTLDFFPAPRWHLIADKWKRVLMNLVVKTVKLGFLSVSDEHLEKLAIGNFGWIVLATVVNQEMSKKLDLAPETRNDHGSRKRRRSGSTSWQILTSMIGRLKDNLNDCPTTQEDMNLIWNFAKVARHCDEKVLNDCYSAISWCIPRMLLTVILCTDETAASDAYDSLHRLSTELLKLGTIPDFCKLSADIARVALLPLLTVGSSENEDLLRYINLIVPGPTKASWECSRLLSCNWKNVEKGFRLLASLPRGTQSPDLQTRLTVAKQVFEESTGKWATKCRRMLLENAGLIYANFKMTGFAFLKAIIGGQVTPLLASEDEAPFVANLLKWMPCALNGSLVLPKFEDEDGPVICASCDNGDLSMPAPVPRQGHNVFESEADFVESVFLRAAEVLQVAKLGAPLGNSFERWMKHNMTNPSAEFIKSLFLEIFKDQNNGPERQLLLRQIPWLIVREDEVKFLSGKFCFSSRGCMPVELEEAVLASRVESNSIESLDAALFATFDEVLGREGTDGCQRTDVIVGIGSCAKLPRLQARCFKALTDVLLYQGTRGLRASAAMEIQRVAKWFGTTPRALAALHAAELGACLAAFVVDRGDAKEGELVYYRSLQVALGEAWGFGELSNSFDILLHRIVCPVIVASLRRDGSFKGLATLAQWVARAKSLPKGHRIPFMLRDSFPKIFPILMCSSKGDPALKLIEKVTKMNIEYFVRANYQAMLNELLLSYSINPEGILRGITLLALQEHEQQKITKQSNKAAKLRREEIAEFLRLRILGALCEFDLLFVKPSVSLGDKIVAVQSLKDIIVLLGPEIVTNLRHKFMMSLRTLQRLHESGMVAEHAVGAWSNFAANLREGAAGTLAREMAISLVPWAAMQPVAVSNLVKGLFAKQKEWTQVVSPQLLDISFLQLLKIPQLDRVVEEIYSSLKISQGYETVQEIRKALAGLKLKDSELKKHALMNLKRCLTTDDETVLDVVTNFQQNSVLIQEIVDGLMILSRTADSGVLPVIAECFGAVGAVDPGQLQLTRFTANKDSEHFFTNIRGDDFIKDLILRLVDAFLSLDSLHNQNCCAYALQQVMKACKVGPGAKTASKSTGQNLWKTLDAGTKEVLSPLLKSMYMVKDSDKSEKTFQSPLFGSRSYSEWITVWLLVLMQSVNSSTKELLEATKPIFKVDVGVAQHLLPYVILHAVIEGSDADRENIRKEIFSVLGASASRCRKWMENDELSLSCDHTQMPSENQISEGLAVSRMNDKSSMDENAGRKRHTEDSAFHCAQTVFTALDYLTVWALKMKASLMQSTERSEESVSRVENFLNKIDQLTLAEAALGCHAFRRALKHMESYLLISHGEIQNKLRFLQYVYLHLDESDGVAGVSAIRSAPPNLREQIADHEASGKLHHALVTYEKALRQNPNSTFLLTGKLRTLMDMDQCQTALMLCQSMEATKSSLPSLAEFQVEASWRLGNWDTLSKLQNSTERNERSWSVEIGKALATAYTDGPWTGIEQHLKILRTLEVEPLTTASLEIGSYTLAYSHILRLHLVHEMEAGLKVLVRWKDSWQKRRPEAERIYQLEKLVSSWNSRAGLVQHSLRVIEPLQALRRSTLGLLASVASSKNDGDSLVRRVNDEIDRSWLLSAKAARKSQHYHRAYSCLLNAERPIIDAEPGSAASLLRAEVLIEKAKLDWKNGNQEEAMRLLNSSVEFYLTPQGADADISVDKDMAAMTRLLLTQYWEEAGYQDSAKIRSSYERVCQMSSDWEQGYFYLAKYLDKVHSSKGDRSRELQPDLVHTIVTSYGKSLVYGFRHVYEALPRLLTLWMEFGTAIETVRSSSSKSGTASNAQSIMRVQQNLKELTKTVSETFDSLPNFVLMTCFNQLLSRICHPSDVVYDALRTWIARLVGTYYRQAIWMLLAVLKSSHDVRRNRCHQILQTAKQRLPADTRTQVSKVMDDTLTFSDLLLKLSEHGLKTPGSSGGGLKGPLSMSTHFPELVKLLGSATFSQVLIPVSSLMSVTFPSGPGEALDESDDANVNLATQWQCKRNRSHDWKAYHPFPKREVYFKNFEEKVIVMKSLQMPKKISAVGSDGKIYGFLCKARDDLRKDCRLLEFTNLVNRCLKQDAEARKKALQIRTYHVSPLNEDCGIIEWVPNCLTLRQILNDQYLQRGAMLDYVRKHALANNVPLEKKRDWFLNTILPRYPTVLPYWFQTSFPDPQAWYAARSAFVRTTSVISIIGYILGLGDRHCENILMDAVTGDVMHVDFNCLFNRGELFEVPERVPFRLTHNIVGAMGPTGYEGAFRRGCETTLRVVREHRDSFVSVLQSFVYDPSLDLVGPPRRGSKDPSHEAGVLERANAVVLDVEERIRGVLRVRQYRGSAQPAGRPQLVSKLPLSIEGHVNHVIQEATNVDNLCQMFMGWAPHM